MLSAFGTDADRVDDFSEGGRIDQGLYGHCDLAANRHIAQLADNCAQTVAAIADTVGHGHEGRLRGQGVGQDNAKSVGRTGAGNAQRVGEVVAGNYRVGIIQVSEKQRA